ncbi:MAG: hypothetical protein GWN79_20895 [Actinobacteria bacterium]|nr:hypothetical protein [Actinomycetota bacterium]NIS34744.1 hypothetical protein [Actinomycetota bacterium]NIT97734.1 hypothetical protein [Actinomycetota bacterium]NIU21374.1 hypothetical protein [Actinomycetota bacterium]NIU69500.1 hypothetical protein [Actinomycetota bacterium]
MGLLHRARWAKGLAGFLDDELGPEALERMIRHLEECPGCLRELELLARMQQSLARLTPAR